MRQIKKEQKMDTLNRQKKELDILENDWRIAMEQMNDKVRNDKKSYQLKSKAHQDALRKARVGVKKNLKSQLDEMCLQIVDEDRKLDQYREKDIERLREEVMKMKFKEPS